MYAQRNDLCVQASREHIEPPVPAIAAFTTRHKIDPKDVPQLSPPPPAPSPPALGGSPTLGASFGSHRLGNRWGVAGSETVGGAGQPERTNGTEAEVLAAIEESVGALHTRMITQPD